MSSYIYFQLYRDEENPRHWRWVLRDPNGTDLAISPRPYQTRLECLQATENVKRGAGFASIHNEDGSEIPSRWW